jgi:ferrous iron transport protein B
MAPAQTAVASRRLTVALIGNPNTGKSTLFNALAGMNARVGNFPGCTVEKKIGHVHWDGQRVALVDLPGTYSLSPRSLDEMVSVDVLLGRQADVGTPDAAVCIVDAANLERNLYLVCQVLDLGLPAVVCLNMTDVAEARGVRIDTETLSRRLGVPVVRTEAHRRRGMEELRSAVLHIADQPPAPRPDPFPPAFREERERLAERLAGMGRADVPLFLLDRLLIDVGGQVERELSRSLPELPAELVAARERLANAGCRVPAAEARYRYAWARTTLDGVLVRPTERKKDASDAIDRFLTHRVAGLVVFAALMFLVFQAIYAWAGPFMDWIEAGQGVIAEAVNASMGPGPLRSLLVDGAIAGVGGVLVFLPQIVLLFLFIAILEDCGYMARAAFLMDKLMTKVGLSGKSFVPLMSSYACAVPGVMATRVIEDRSDRMITMLIAPLMSCSARLPVYLLLIAAFVPSMALLVVPLGGERVTLVNLHGLVLFAFYALGAIVAVPVAWLLKKTFFKGETPPFVMELPSYKWPSPRIVLARVYDRGKAFVLRAGTLIFAASIVIWAAGYFPGDRSELHAVQAKMEALESEAELTETEEAELARLDRRHREISGELLRGSLLGQAGHAIEPVVRPLGWDWKIGIGAIASFPAREVIIATMGTIYSLGGDIETDEPDRGLMERMQSARWDSGPRKGERVYNLPVALSIMVFFALCAQCAATLMTIQKESNSWRWPLFTFAYMTTLAYLGALVTYQVGTAVWGA